LLWNRLILEEAFAAEIKDIGNFCWIGVMQINLIKDGSKDMIIDITTFI
jgi:hypothetical protein